MPKDKLLFVGDVPADVTGEKTVFLGGWVHGERVQLNWALNL